MQNQHLKELYVVSAPKTVTRPTLAKLKEKYPNFN